MKMLTITLIIWVVGGVVVGYLTAMKLIEMTDKRDPVQDKNSGQGFAISTDDILNRLDGLEAEDMDEITLMEALGYEDDKPAADMRLNEEWELFIAKQGAQDDYS